MTERERQVLSLVAGGERDQDIAELLDISVRTVQSYMDRIRDKTGLRRRPELVRLALEGGISNVGKEWAYAWPAHHERYETYTDQTVQVDHKTVMVRVARGARAAWGRKDRGRIVVFGKGGQAGKLGFYPWVEFTECDESGLYSAVIPDPANPRRLLRDGDELPTHFSGKDVRRVDEIINGIKDGPSLRLVLPGSAEPDMVRHAAWVARVRGRLGP